MFRIDKLITFLVLVGLGLWLGLLLGDGAGTLAPPPSASSESAASPPSPTRWTCSMHPAVQLPGPGACPLCGMDLIPLTGGPATGTGSRRLEMSEAARALAQVRTAPVVRRHPVVEIALVGKVAFDETRQAHITSRVKGRIDRMYVDYTGIDVNEHDHMVSIYSPQLVTAQKELTQAMKIVENLGPTASAFMKESARSTVVSAQEKLRLLGMTTNQVDSFRKSGQVQDHVTIHAPIAGVVVEKNVQEGAYVDEGSRIYSIVDLDHLWVVLDAYEMDLPWLRYGQSVTFETQGYPGRTFTGRVSFIHPTLDESTRTVKVRVNAENPGRLLKPGMFVRARVEAGVATHGKVMDPSLDGKWICPMHPEIVRDVPAPCPVCGMDLVTATSLGYEPAGPTEPPLVIPDTAPLITGKRAVVYVEVPDAPVPTYEGRDVILGTRAGDVYLVESGLDEGERVVVEGNFKIDSALQIQGRPSMMTSPRPAALQAGERNVDARRAPIDDPPPAGGSAHSGSDSSHGDDHE